MIELRRSFRGAALLGQLFWPTMSLAAIAWTRARNFGASGFPVGTLALPGVLGMFVALGGFLMIQYLAAEREDGTLLRARATPHGIDGYFVGKLVTVAGTVIVYLAIVLLPGMVLVDGLDVGNVGAWLSLAGMVTLGILATLPIGVMLGSLISSPRSISYLSLPVMGLIGISGIFYPITALAQWLHATAQLFPFYWLGLGMRAALLPDSAAIVEIGGSWRPLETLAVLAVWAAVGVAVGPLLLRRMARRESGATVAKRHELALQRTA